MRNYLFDTGTFSLFFSGNMPEKWIRYWNEIRNGSKNLILFEMLISEIFYKNSGRHGFQDMKNKVMEIKSLKGSRIIKIDDNHAFAAGEYMVSYTDSVYRMWIPIYLL